MRRVRAVEEQHQGGSECGGGPDAPLGEDEEQPRRDQQRGDREDAEGEVLRPEFVEDRGVDEPRRKNKVPVERVKTLLDRSRFALSPKMRISSTEKLVPRPNHRQSAADAAIAAASATQTFPSSSPAKAQGASRRGWCRVLQRRGSDRRAPPSLARWTADQQRRGRGSRVPGIGCRVARHRERHPLARSQLAGRDGEGAPEPAEHQRGGGPAATGARRRPEEARS